MLIKTSRCMVNLDHAFEFEYHPDKEMLTIWFVFPMLDECYSCERMIHYTVTKQEWQNFLERNNLC